VVSNPLDVMTYCAFITSKFPANRVFGMAGILDTARYRAFLATELNVSPKDIQAVLMGGHGDTMVPLPRYTTVGGIPVTELIACGQARCHRGAHQERRWRDREPAGHQSAWYAPGTAAAQMVEAIVRDQKRVFPVLRLAAG
jgi:malate dehydrogenase